MDELDWLFLGVEALADKVIPERAMRTLYEPVYPGVYAPCGIELSARQRAVAAWLWSRRHAVVVGNSAAALLGAKWVDAAGRGNWCTTTTRRRRSSSYIATS